MAFTFDLEVPDKSIQMLERLASAAERVGEEASKVKIKMAEALDAATLKGAAAEYMKLAEAQGRWVALQSREARTAKDLIRSMKKYNEALVDTVNQIDRATAADKAHIEINRHRIRETLRYEVGIKKALAAEKVLNREQEKELENVKKRLELKKKLAALEYKLNPKEAVKQLQSEVSIAEEMLKVRKELLQVSSQQTAMNDRKVAGQLKDIEYKKAIIAQQKEEIKAQAKLKAAKKGMLSLTSKEIAALKLVTKEHITYQAALKRVADQSRKLTLQQKIMEDQQKRLATAQIKNSAEFLRTEKTIAELESRYRRATQTITHFNAVHAKGGIIVSTFRNVMDAMGRHIAVYTAGMVGVAAAVYGTTRAVRSGFEAFNGYTEAMARVQAVSGATAEQMLRMEEEARLLGRTTRFSAVEAAEGLVQLTMAGLSANEATAALAPTLTLASIGAMQFGEAADIVTNIMRGFALEAADLPHVIDVMATSVTSSNMTVQQLGNAMSYVAPVAQSFGVSVEEVSASMEVLHNSGIKASRAGTGMRKTLLSIYAPTKKAAEALERMGVSTITMSGQARPLIEILHDMNKAFLEGKATVADFKDIVGVRAANSFLQLIKASDGTSESLERLVERLHNASGASARMREDIEDFIGADWEKLKDALIDIGLGLIELYETPIRSWIQGVTKSISDLAGNEAAIKAIADELRALGEAVMFVGKAFLLYKVVQTVHLLAVNAIETAKYIASLGTRLLESAGLVRGWSAAIISGNAQVAASSAEASVIVDAAGKKMQSSMAATAASSVLFGKTFTGTMAKVVSMVKWFGRFAAGAGLVTAGLWALSEAVGWLFGSFMDTERAIEDTSKAFSSLSDNISKVSQEMNIYESEARQLLELDESTSISAVARALEEKTKAAKSLSSEQANYRQLQEQLISLESKEQLLLADSGKVAEERLNQLRRRKEEIQALMSKSMEAQATLQGTFKTNNLTVLEEQIRDVTNALDRYEEQLLALKDLERRTGNTGLSYAIEKISGLVDSATQKLYALIDARNQLNATGTGTEGGEPTSVGPELSENARRAYEELRNIIAEVNSGGDSAAAQLARIRAGLEALADGRLPEGINTTNGAIQWLKEVTSQFRSVAEGVRRDAVKEAEAQEKHAETMRKLAEEQQKLTAAKKGDLSISQRYSQVQNALKTTLAEIARLEKLEISGKKLSEAQRKKLQELAKKYNLTLKDEAAILKELKKLEDDHAKKLNNMLGEVAPAVKLTQEYAEKLALVKELLDKGMISQQQMNDWIRDYSKAVQEASASTGFERKLLEYSDLVGNLREKSGEWLDSFTNDLAKFIRTGKADFSNFVDSVLDDLAKMAAQQIVVSIAGVVTGVSGLGGSLMSTAGGFQQGQVAPGSGFPGTGMFSGVGGSLLAGAGSWLAGTSLAAGSPFLTGIAGGMINAGTLGVGGMFSTIGLGLTSGTMAGLGAAIGAAVPILLPLLFMFGGSLFGDKEAPSRFRITPGLEPNYSNKKRPWERTDFGAWQYGKHGELIAVSVNSVLGNMGAGGSGFGKDEQLSDEDREKYVRAMKDVFVQLAAVDEAIVTTYDLSDEAIERIKAATNSMKEMVKKRKAPDLGEYVIERYNIVFKEIGGVAEKMFHDLTQSGLDAENAIKALTATLTFDELLTGLEKVKEDAATLYEQMNMTQLERLEQQRESIFDLVDAYDGSVESVEALNQALDAQRQGTIGLLLEIEKIRDAMTDAFAGTREKIETSLMNDSEKYSYYQKQLDFWAGILANATDPARINEAQAKINEFVSKLWDIQLAAGPNAAGQTQKEWLEYLAEQEKVANEQLDKAAQEASDRAQELHDAVKTAIETAVIPLKDAADTTNDTTDLFNGAVDKFLDAVGIMESASKEFSYAASEIAGTTITVDLTGWQGSAVGA